MRELRKQKNMTLAQVSKTLKIGLNTLAVYERGEHEAGYDVLCNMSKLYDVSIDYLLGNIDDSQSTSNSLTIIQAKELWLSSLRDFDRTLVESVLRLDEKHKYQVFGYIESMARA